MREFHYLVFGTPFAAVMVCVATSHRGQPVARASRRNCHVHPVVAGLHTTIIPYRIIQFAEASFPNIGADVLQALAKLPGGRAVYIPHVFWPVAVHDTKHDIRWWTLPIASPRETRQAYEKAAFGRAVPGDYLIVDNGTAGTVDKFGLLSTFALLPPGPAHWTLVRTEKKLFAGSVPWGLDLLIYEFSNP